MKQRKYKSVSHWLSYNGKYLAYSAIAAMLVLILRLNQQSGSIPCDYRISWIGKTALSQEEADILRAAAAGYGSDLNADGIVTLDLVQYIIDFEEARGADDAGILRGAYEQVTKLLTRLQEKDCYLFLTDDPSSVQFTTGIFRYLDGRIPGEEAHYEYENWEQMALPLSLEGMREGIWLARRCLFEKEADYEAVFPGGEALFRALTLARQPAAPDAKHPSGTVVPRFSVRCPAACK